MTNVPAPTFTPRGFIVPADSEILAGTLEDINAAFGGGLNPSLSTPQGQLASSQAACVANADDQFVNLSRQMDPAYNDGRWQDGIARIYFLSRLPSRPTVVQCTCAGLTGVIIPVGARARAADGLLYTSTEAGEIPVEGTVVLSFSCDTVGPIACPADTLNEIYQSVNGWESINNASDGVLGVNTESRADFELRRAASVALNSRGSLPSVQGAVLSVANVLDAYVTENDTAGSITRGGVVLPARCLYVAAVGGLAQDVAQAIWSKKNPGCGYYPGNTTETVQDTNPAYNPPYPSYDVTFEIPNGLPILYAVRIVNNAQVPADAATQIQDAIIAAFSGSDGGARARIGSTIYASRYYAPVTLLGTWAQIVAIEIGSANDPDAVVTGSIAGTNLTVTVVASGTLAVGQTLLDAAAGITTATTIVSQTSGPAGGTGVYVVSNSQTVTSRTIDAVLPTSNFVDSRIDQVPTIARDNILVTLV